MDKRFPNFYNVFNNLTDSRKRQEYTMTELLMGTLFMFLMKESSRNGYNNDRRDKEFRDNYRKVFGHELPHPDTADKVLRILPPVELEELKATLVAGLFEQKLLRQFRFLGKYYTVSFDATGTCSFDHRHCDHCLTKTSKTGVVTYFHYVLEAKLVTSTGLSISMGSEFIENDPDENFKKQDCELKAFKRLAVKLKGYFPRLQMCILADGLYPNQHVFKICRDNNWRFIFTLSDDSLKSFTTEARSLETFAVPVTVHRANSTSRIDLEYKYVNDLEYCGFTYSWVRCKQITMHKSGGVPHEKEFVYITDIQQDKQMVVTTSDTGRLRWKIENEGFNIQKNNGYELGHLYSRVSYTAMKNYYQILQLAHAINQFVEMSKEVIELLAEHSKQTIVALWKDAIFFMKCPQQIIFETQTTGHG